MKRVGSLSRFRSTGSLVRRLESLDEQTSSTSLDTDDLAARLRSLAVAASFDKPPRAVRIRRRAVAFLTAIGVFGWVGITGAAASIGLAATGNLPAPIQDTVSNVLDVVGIEVPRSEPEVPTDEQEEPTVEDSPVDASVPVDGDVPAAEDAGDEIDDGTDTEGLSPDRAVPLNERPFAPFDSVPEAPGRSGTIPTPAKTPPGRSGTTPPQVGDSVDEFVPPGQDKKDDSSEPAVGPGNSGGAGNSGNSNAGGNSGSSGNSGNSNAGGNSGDAGNSGSSNAGGNSGSAGSSGNSGSSNAGGNSGGAGNSGNSNAGGNRSGRP